MKRVFICEILNEQSVKKARRANCETIVFKSRQYEAELPDVHLKNVNDADRKAFENTFFNNKRRLKQLAEKAPDFFTYHHIQLLKAINKDLFWATRVDGMLAYTLQNLGADIHKIHEENSLAKTIKKAAKTILLIIIYLRNKILNRGAPLKTMESPGKNCSYGFYVENDFQLDYLKSLKERFGQNALYISGFAKRQFSNDQTIEYLPVTNSFAKFSLRSLIFGLQIFGPDEFLKLVEIRKNLINGIYFNQSCIVHYGLKAIFLVAQENTGFGNITAQVARKKGVLTINSHNGIKSKDVYNRDNHFDIWCVWDQKMKDLLSEDCGIKQETLFVTGHLKQDEIRNHRYSGALSDFAEKKKVISLFSIPRPIHAKIEVFKFIRNYIASRPDYRLIVRLHPSEDVKDWNTVEANDENVLFVNAGKEKKSFALYDQLAITSLSIVFGSTVALESKWFGVPCITFEEREKSLLYCVDDNFIKHVSSIDNLELTLKSGFNHRIDTGKSNQHVSTVENVVSLVEQKLKENEGK